MLYYACGNEPQAIQIYGENVMRFKVDFSPRSRKNTGFTFEIEAHGPVHAKSLGRQMLMNMGEDCTAYKEPKVKIVDLQWETQSS